MTRLTRLLCAAAISTAALAACNDDDSGNAALPPVPVAQTVDTAQVLALAQHTSETTSPFQVNGGLVTFDDTSETSQPIAVNGM